MKRCELDGEKRKVKGEKQRRSEVEEAAGTRRLPAILLLSNGEGSKERHLPHCKTGIFLRLPAQIGPLIVQHAIWPSN